MITNFNFDCSELICSLHKQLTSFSELKWELIIIDDCSPKSSTLDTNIATAQSMVGCRYIVNDKNEGAAVCRNRLSQIAKGEWLIFIDGDARVSGNHDFIDKYWANRHLADVVVGGLMHPEKMPTNSCALRFRYEKEADKLRSVEGRSKSPYDKFTAFNIMVRKVIFDIVRFDETCTEYGYEDALFGIELKNKSISLCHIDNILVHTGLDSNESFLRKTEVALKTLFNLQKQGKMIGECRIGKAAETLEHLKMDKLYAFLFKMSRNLVKQNLSSRHPSLLLFSLYKLGLFIEIKSERL